MKRMITIIALVLSIGNAFAQSTEKDSLKMEKAVQDSVKQELKESEKKAKALDKAIADTLRYRAAVNAINHKEFVMQADEVTFMRGREVEVSSALNYVAIDSVRAIVQVGVAGISIDGKITQIETHTSKKGNVSVSMEVMGVRASVRVELLLHHGDNEADVTIVPNFVTGRVFLSGVVIPASLSNTVRQIGR